jgi:hypothetical protein
MWLSASLPAVLKLSFWYVGFGTSLGHVSAECFAVVAFVGIELQHPAFSSNSQLIHGSLGTDNVITVTFKRHVC